MNEISLTLNQVVSNVLTADCKLTADSAELISRAIASCEQIEAPVKHSFGPNLYIRTVFFPAGAYVVGGYQKFEHLNIMLQGKVQMLTEDGIKTFTAPMSFVGQPGQKIGYIEEDTVWQNVYSTSETDVDKLEATFIDMGSLFDETKQQRFIEQANLHEDDRKDYAEVIALAGYTEDQVQVQVNDQNTMTDDPIERIYRVRNSPIHGKGIFIEQPAPEGFVIGPATIGGKRTSLGRYTNHSATPNSKFVRSIDDELYLVATKYIKGQCGGFQGDEVTIDYRHALELTQGITFSKDTK